MHTFSPEANTPTGQVADREVCAPYEDLDAVRAFRRRERGRRLLLRGPSVT